MTALLIGWDAEGGAPAAVAAFALLLLLRFSLVRGGVPADDDLQHLRGTVPDAEGNVVLMAVVWPPAITGVFLPLAVRRFQGLSR